MNPPTDNHTLQPYLFFNGRAEEAIRFYEKAIGATEEMLMRMKDNPEPQPGCGDNPEIAEKVMHARLRIGNTILLVSDGRCQGNPQFEGFALALNAANEAEVDRWFNALAEGGKAIMGPMKTFFAARFGMVEDRFGVEWTILTH